VRTTVMTTLRTFLLPLVLGGALLPAAAAQQPVPATAVPQAGDGELDAVVAAVFRSPAFRQRFAESYLADTEIEPTVTDDDRDLLVEIGELLAVPAEQGGPKTDEAIGLLRGRVGPVPAPCSTSRSPTCWLQKERSRRSRSGLPARRSQKKPKFRRAWNNLGLLQVRQRRLPRGGIVELARVLELGGGNAFTYGLLGVAHGNNDDHLAAESAYRMASLLDPADRRLAARAGALASSSSGASPRQRRCAAR
jgi:hypothetical protein